MPGNPFLYRPATAPPPRKRPTWREVDESLELGRFEFLQLYKRLAGLMKDRISNGSYSD